MAPALGLYLGELFFDGYNKKQRQQMENDLRLAKKRAEAKGKAWPPAPAAVTAPAPVAVAVTAAAVAGADEDSSEHPAKRAKLDPSTEAEPTAASVAEVAAKPAAAVPAVEKDDEGQVTVCLCKSYCLCIEKCARTLKWSVPNTTHFLCPLKCPVFIFFYSIHQF